MENSTIKKLQKELSLFKDSYAPEDTIKKVSSKIENMLESRKQLEKVLTQENVFSNEKLIQKYIEKYFNAALELFSERQNIEPYDIINAILLLDYEQKSQQLGLFSPLMLNTIVKISSKIKDYESFSKSERKDKLFNGFCNNIFINEIEKLSYYMNDNENNLMYFTAKINTDLEESILDKPDLNTHLSFQAKQISKLTNTTSFFNLSKVNISEKIAYELSKYLDTVKNKSKVKDINFTVAVIGELNSDFLKENLPLYIEDAFNKYENLKNISSTINIHIQIDVFSERKSKVSSLNNNLNFNTINGTKFEIKLNHINSHEDKFKSKKFLNNLLNNHCVTFILDTMILYTPIYISAAIDVPVIISHLEFDGAFYRFPYKEEMVMDMNMLDGLYELLTSLYRNDVIGYFKKNSSDRFIESLETLVEENKSKNKFSTIYLYLSEAKTNIHLNEKAYLHTDIYNQKDITIYRIGTYDETMNLPYSNEYGKQIGFSIWQVIEKFTLNKRDEIIAEIMDIDVKDISIEKAFRELNNRYLYINYENIFYEIPLLYEKNDKISENFVMRVIKPLFSTTSENIFKRDFTKTLISILYMNSQSMQDILFVYFMRTIRHPELTFKKIKTILPPKFNYRYSCKRYIEMVCNDFDISANRSLNQVLTSGYITANKLMTSTYGDFQSFYEKICKAAEEIGYTNSYLQKKLEDKNNFIVHKYTR